MRTRGGRVTPGTSGAPPGRASLATVASAALGRTWSVFRAQWARFAVVIGLVTALAVLGALFLMRGLFTLGGAQRDLIIDDLGAPRASGLAVLALELGIPAFVAAVALTSAWMSVIASVSDEAISGGRPSLRVAVRRGVRRVPALFGAVLLALSVVVALALATPVLMVAGAVGLVLTPVVRLARHRWPGLRWPAPRTLALLLIPFSSAARQALRWSLVIPAAALERNGPRAALRRSRVAVAPRPSAVAVVLLVTVVGFYGLQHLVVGVGGALNANDRQVFLVRSLVQLLFASVPVIAATVLFRDALPTTDPALALDADLPPGPKPLVHPTAVALVWLLVATGVAGALVIDAVPAHADPLYTVDSLADQGDATPGDGVCATVGSVCTLRAAVDEVNAGAAPPYAIAFGVSGTIAVTSPIVVTADVALDGTGQHVTIDGGGAHQLLSFPSIGGSYQVTNLTLAHGFTTGAAGGGAIQSAANGSLQRVTFVGNAATGGPGGAFSSSAGSTTLQNATFVGNTAAVGGDIANAGASVAVRSSTLADATGGSIHNDDAVGGSIQLASALVAPASGAACTGTTGGFDSLDTDGTCAAGWHAPGLGTFGDHGGWVSTYSILPSSEAVDNGNVDLCPAEDARGTARPQSIRCDIGSFELVPSTVTHTFTVNDLGDGPDATPGDGLCAAAGGVCTLRAAVDEANATTAAAPFTVATFDVGFAVDGTIAVGSTLTVDARFDLDGTGHHVTVDGGNAVRILSFTSGIRPMSLANLTFAHGSTASPDGGGAVFTLADGRLSAVTFVGNAATDPTPGSAGGGAISVGPGAAVDVVNATFSGNAATATTGGSDVFVRGGATITHSTFSGSTSGSVVVDDSSGAVATLQNSLLAGTSGFNCSGTVGGSGNISSDATCPGTTATDPRLGPLGAHGGWVPTITLLPGSPGLDAATGPPCPPTDARGVARPQGAACDLGATEFSDVVTVTASGSANPAGAGSPLTISATVTGTYDPTVATGTVEFLEGATSLGTATLAAGTASITTSTLSFGNHTITVHYAGDGYFAAGSTSYVQAITAPVTVVDLTATPGASVVGQPVRLESHVTAAGATQFATGTVDFFDGATPIGSVPLDPTGWPLAAGAAATLNLPSLSVGSHSFRASYGGDPVFPAATSASVPLTVGQASTTVAVGASPSPSVVGQATTFTATVTAVAPGAGIPTGTVTFADGATALGTVPLDAAGVASWPTSALALGSHPVTATYHGDANYLAASGGVTHVVNVDPTITSTVLASSASPSVWGQSVVLTATAASIAVGGGTPTGRIDFTEGATLLASVPLDAAGQASFATTGLAVGDHVIIATYVSNAAYRGSVSSPITQHVDLAPTVTSVTASPRPSVTGQTVTFVATVAVPAPGVGPAGGTVTFTTGSTTLGTAPVDGTGTATLAVSSLMGSAGSYRIFASYDGDATRAPSFGSVDQTVDPASVTVDLVVTPLPAVVGDTVTFVATLSPIAPGGGIPQYGDVTFTDFGTTIATVPVANGSATLIRTAPGQLGAFAHQIQATYTGGLGYSGATSNQVSFGIDKATPSLVLTSDVASAEPGQPVTLTARLTIPAAVVPTSTLAVYDGSTLLGSGPVSVIDGSFYGLRLTTSTLTLGSHVLSARSNGDANYLPVVAPDLVQSVVPIATQLALAADPPGALAGNPVTFRAFVRNTSTVPTSAGLTPTGTVTITVPDGTWAGVYPQTLTPVPGSPGWASITLPPMSSATTGTFTITAAYAPSGPFQAQSTSLAYAVSSSESRLTITPAASSVAWGAPLAFAVQVTRPGQPAGPPTPTGLVTLTSSDGATCQTVPTSGCSLAFPRPGTSTITASYSGDATYGASVSSPVTVSVTKRPSSIVGFVSPTTVVTGEPTTLSWRVTGPADGQVGVLLPSATCTTALAGSCTATYPLGDAGTAIPVAVTYAGDDLYEPAAYSTTITPLGCYPVPVAVYPPEAGTMRVTAPANCNNGSGYLQGTRIGTEVTLTDRPDYRFEPVTQYPSGVAGTRQSFVVGTGLGEGTYAEAQFTKVAQCVDLVLDVESVGSGGGSFRSSVPPNCPGATSVTSTPTGSVARYLTGTSVTLVPRANADASTFYGVRTRPPSTAFRTIEPLPAMPMVLSGDTYLAAVFGPRCHRVDATTTGLGTATVDTPENCFDPAAPGWTLGTTVDVSAVGADASFLSSWSGATATPGTEVADPATGVITYRTTAVVAAVDQEVTANFEQCVSLETSVRGIGAITRSAGPNCPTKPGETTLDGQMVGWYRPGSRLTLTLVDHLALTSGTGATTQSVGKWTGDVDRPFGHDPERDQSIDVTMLSNRRIRATLYDFRECNELTLATFPAGWGEINSRGVDVDDVCPNGYLRPETPTSTPKGGLFLAGATLRFEARSTKPGMDPLVGFGITHPAGVVENRTAFDGPDMSAMIRRPSTVTATFCEAVNAPVTLIAPDGSETTGPPPDDTDYIVVDPPPNCPYRDDAWVVGTEVTFKATAPRVGYEFVRWNGATATGGAVPGVGNLAKTLTLDGRTPSVDVGITYRVTCHTLTLTGDFSEVTVSPPPNCPGTNADPDALKTADRPAAADGTPAPPWAPKSSPPVGSYIGGTNVVLVGSVPKDKVWLGWSGDADDQGQVNPTSATMDADKTINHAWRSKTLNEKTAKAFTDLGNYIAVGVKKAAGVVLAAMGELLFGAPPLGIVTGIIQLGSLVGDLLAYAGVHTDFTTYMHYAQETVDWLKSSFTCPSKWALAASPPPPTTVVDPDDPDADVTPVTGDVGIPDSELDELVREQVDEELAKYVDDPGEVIRAQLESQIKKQLIKRFKGLNGVTVSARLAELKSAAKASAQKSAYDAIKKQLGGGKRFDKYAKSGAKVVKYGGAVAYTAYAVATSDLGWDKDAKAAWTNGTVLYECEHNAIPSYLKPDPIPDYEPGLYG